MDVTCNVKAANTTRQQQEQLCFQLQLQTHYAAHYVKISGLEGSYLGLDLCEDEVGCGG